MTREVTSLEVSLRFREDASHEASSTQQNNETKEINKLLASGRGFHQWSFNKQHDNLQ